MKIGIMGGTFDPVHNGHLTLAEYACRDYQLDQVWFMPNGNPPHKDNKNIVSTPRERAYMVSLAISGHRNFRLEDYELRRKDVSCSYRTMEYFKKLYPQDHFLFYHRRRLAVLPGAVGACGASFPHLHTPCRLSGRQEQPGSHGQADPTADREVRCGHPTAFHAPCGYIFP